MLCVKIHGMYSLLPFRYCTLILLLMLSFTGIAQKGVLTGKIINAATNQPLIGVSIQNSKLNVFKTSDVEGRFNLQLPAGNYEFRFSFTGFKTKAISDIVIEKGKTTELNIILEEAENNLQEVVVSSTAARRETAASVISLQRNNVSVSDGISAESIRKSPDNNVGEVLKRVTGTSVQEDKYVIVRGLNDRYNIATLNGAVMPSTEPDRRTFSFDVVPSAMIDNVLINKTATPDMPGEFSGGIVQITTKDIPYKKSFSIGLGTSYNTISTGKNFEPGLISSTDYFGFDDGIRAFPNKFPSTKNWRALSQYQKTEVSKFMNNTYGDRYNGTALPGMNAQLSFGTKKDFQNAATLGIIGSLNYRNSQNIEYGFRRQYNDLNSTNNYLSDFSDTTHSFTTTIGGLLNIGYKKNMNKIVLKNLFNRVFENTNTLREGPNYNDLQYIKKSQINVVLQKTILSSQLEGEHGLGKNKNLLKWNINYAFTQKQQPDYKVLPYQASLSEVEQDKNVVYKVATRNTYRFWSTLNEHSFGGKVDYSMPVKLWKTKSQFKAGVLSQYKMRSFDARVFRYEQNANFNQSLLSLTPNTIFNDGNMYEDGFYLNEITNNTDKYDAKALLNAGYVMLDNKFSAKWRFIWGVRTELFNFDVTTANTSGATEKISKNYIDILPSANLIYSVSNKSNIRLSASRTVSRPDFRELANFQYFDFVKGFVISGNSKLERSRNTNIDLRFETFPTSGEIISASLFLKHFDKPIEQVMNSITSPEYQLVSFANPNQAISYGVEFDLRKKLSFINPTSNIFNNLTFSANLALIKSRVDVKGLDISRYDEDRPMQGQSPYLINIGLNYFEPVGGWSATVLYNRIGERIEVVGAESYPDIYENGRDVMDLQLAKKLFKNKGEVKLNVSNLFDAAQILYQNTSDKKTSRSYNADDDRIIWSKRFGRTISIGFTYNFN